MIYSSSGLASFSGIPQCVSSDFGSSSSVSVVMAGFSSTFCLPLLLLSGSDLWSLPSDAFIILTIFAVNGSKKKVLLRSIKLNG
jgi:hypothetical protein